MLSALFTTEKNISNIIKISIIRNPVITTRILKLLKIPKETSLENPIKIIESKKVKKMSVANKLMMNEP